jgi:hypothetical protein
MGRKKELNPDNPEQSAKFIELAKEYPVDEQEFNQLFKKIVEANRTRKPKDKTKEVQP